MSVKPHEQTELLCTQLQYDKMCSIFEKYICTNFKHFGYEFWSKVNKNCLKARFTAATPTSHKPTWFAALAILSTAFSQYM